MTTYSEQWKNYRRWRRLLLLIFLGYIPGVWLISTSLTRYLNWEHAEMVIALSWMFAFAVIGIRFTLWPCPRCGRGFFATWWYSNQFARKCVHCGLPKWIESDPSKESSNHTSDGIRQPADGSSKPSM